MSALIVKSALATAPRTAAAAPAIALGGGLAVLPWPQIDFAKFGTIERVAMVAHPQAVRPEPASQLDQHSARHQQ